MSQLIRSHYEKLAAGFAVAAVAASVAWVWTRQSDFGGLRRGAAAELRNDFSAPAAAPGLAAPAAWPKPASQSHGSGWLYEVFTPPVIYYNAVAKSFAVTPPAGQVEGSAAFGLELLDANFEPYRLQLAGYFGEPGDYLAAFVSPGQPETLLARNGRRFEQLGLILRSFEVRKIVVAHDDAWPVYDVAGLAVVQDEKTGEEVTLDTRSRKLTDTPRAVLRRAGTTDQPRVLHEGDTLADDMATYRIERIQVDPPEVVVAKQTPGLPLPETRVLKPVAREGVTAKAGRPKQFPAPPKTGLATSRP